MSTGVRRRFDIDPAHRFSSYAERQKLYLDSETGWLIPRTTLYQSEILQMQVNAVGCKGPECALSKATIAFYGDSATMGHAFTPDSWPLHIDIDGYQPLNAAIEGANMAHMVKRHSHLSEQIGLDAVVVYLGWHNIVYGETGEAYWESQLRQFLGAHVSAFCTIVSCMTEDFRSRGFGPLLKRDALTLTVGAAEDAQKLDEDFFNFWMEQEATPEFIARILDQIARYNRFLHGFCAATGSVLVDLNKQFTPDTYEAAPDNFYDVCHLRPHAYASVGAFVGDALRPVLRTVQPGSAQTALPVPSSSPVRTHEDLKSNVYPLW